MKETQDQIHEWSTRNFGRSVDVQKYVNISSFLGMVEELGEISHAILKMAQGISGSERKHWEDIEDGIADLVVFCLDFCARQETVGHPLDAEELLLRVWAKVRQRDFRQDPLTGGREAIEGMDGTELAAHMGEVPDLPTIMGIAGDQSTTINAQGPKLVEGVEKLNFPQRNSD